MPIPAKPEDPVPIRLLLDPTETLMIGGTGRLPGVWAPLTDRFRDLPGFKSVAIREQLGPHGAK